MQADEERAAVKVPTTSYAILGLLTFGERSGYDLAKFANRSVGYFFNPAKSQIYGELRRLVSLGWAREREVEQEGRPDKRLYEVTAEGQRALEEWLESSPVEPEELKSPFLVKVFLGRHMRPESLRAQLEDMRRQARQRLDEYREIERAIKGQPEFLFPYLTLKCGLAHARADIRWIDEAITELEKGGP